MNIELLFFKHARAFHGSILVFALFTVFALPLLSSCDNKQAQPTTIGILLFGDSRQPQVDGFIDEMKQFGYEESNSLKYVIRNAKNDRKKLPGLVKEMLHEQPDLMVAAGGLEADTMKKVLGDQGVPVVVLYINAIIERGLVKSREQSDWNVTGVDNLNAELSGKRVELIHNMFTEARRLLILYYENIAPSRIGVHEATIVASKLGIEIDARAVTSREDIQKVMASIKPGEVDVMLTVPTAPIDNALKDIILPQIDRLNIPLFTHSRPLAEMGAFASYGASFYDLGQQSARLADKILKGVDASNIPFETPKKFVYTVNKDVQQKLNIEIMETTKYQINEFVNIRK